MSTGVLGGSGPEECEGDDGDAVGAAVGVSAGVDDHLVDEAVAELLVEPVEVLDVGGSDGVGEFDLDRDCGSVCRFYDQVDFVVGVLGAKVPDAGVGCFGVDPHTDWAVNDSKCVRCHRKPSQV